MITVDESLAKGLAKRACRELREGIQSRMKAPVHSFKTITLANFYKKLVALILDTAGDAVIMKVEKRYRLKKNNCTFILFWQTDDYRFYIDCYRVDYRIHKDNPEAYTFLTISNHAIERIFKRSNSTDTKTIDNEIAGIVATAILISKTFVTNKFQLAQEAISLPTPNGLAVLTLDESGPPLVKTWLSDKQLAGSQKEELKKEINLNKAITINVTQGAKQKNITIKLIDLTADNLAEILFD
ncbi:MAG: hypothetical protein ACPHLK_10335 [Gammaproteobacteria bacterium]|jgi:hypothetical protein